MADTAASSNNQTVTYRRKAKHEMAAKDSAPMQHVTLGIPKRVEKKFEDKNAPRRDTMRKAKKLKARGLISDHAFDRMMGKNEEEA
jgi:hypothetical protein